MSDKENEQSQANDVRPPAEAVQAEVASDEVMTPSNGTPAHGSEEAAPAAVPEAAPEPVPLPLPGEVLAARRIERRMSIEEVSARIKLAPRQIAALEQNDFAALPGMVTTRGFIRSYARLLDIDPEPLLSALADEPNPAFAPLVIRRPLPSPEFSGRRYAPPTSHRREARRLPALAAVMLVFVGTLAYVGYRQQWLELSPIALPVISGMASPAAGEATGQVADDSLTAAAPVAVLAEAEAAETPASVVPAALTPANALQLAAREDAWIEVIAIDGERKLVSKLMKAGATELVEITEPVVLVVGNAAGIDAALRGQSLNLRAAARDNVAKLSLK